MQGKIMRLNPKGFGFIGVDGEESNERERKDLFFHMSDLVGVDFNSLQQGQAVTFERVDSEKGPKATKVTLVA